MPSVLSCPNFDTLLTKLLRPTFFTSLLQLDFKGDKIPLPLNKDIVEWAIDTQRIMHSAKLPEGVKFYNLYGTMCDTPYHAWLVKPTIFSPLKTPHLRGWGIILSCIVALRCL